MNFGAVRNRGMNAGWILVLAATTALAGCGNSGDEADTTGTIQTNGALVSYTRTGGVGGVDETLRIEPDGTATLRIGEPQNVSNSFELSANELERVQSLLDAADLDAMPADPQPTGCADCFVYTVEYGGHTITYDDASPPPAPVGTLVTDLGELTSDNYPASAAGFVKGG
jgi:hypothetical protein